MCFSIRISQPGLSFHLLILKTTQNKKMSPLLCWQNSWCIVGINLNTTSWIINKENHIHEMFILKWKKCCNRQALKESIDQYDYSANATKQKYRGQQSAAARYSFQVKNVFINLKICMYVMYVRLSFMEFLNCLPCGMCLNGRIDDKILYAYVFLMRLFKKC